MLLSLPLDQFSFSFPDDNKIAIKFSIDSHENTANWKFWQIKLCEGYILALAAKLPKNESKCIITSEKQYPHQIL